LGALSHGKGIAIENVVTCKAIDCLRRSLARATGVAEQGIVTCRSINDFRSGGFRHSGLLLSAISAFAEPQLTFISWISFPCHSRCCDHEGELRRNRERNQRTGFTLFVNVERCEFLPNIC
jgi:hypothetical protein